MTTLATTMLILLAALDVLGDLVREAPGLAILLPPLAFVILALALISAAR